MYDEKLLMDKIFEETGIPTSYTREATQDLLNNHEPVPRIYVGHIGIKLQYPEELFANGYSELENQELLVTTIQLICLRTELHIIRPKIKNAYTGFSPFANDANYSSIVFISADTVAATNKKIWWVETVGCVMPRIS